MDQQLVINLASIVVSIVLTIISTVCSGNQAASVHRAISANSYLHEHRNAEARYDAAGRHIGNFATAEGHAKGTSIVNGVGADVRTDT